MYNVENMLHYKFILCNMYFVKIKCGMTWKIIIINKPI